jgi:hypothetical protein
MANSPGGRRLRGDASSDPPRGGSYLALTSFLPAVAARSPLGSQACNSTRT